MARLDLPTDELIPYSTGMFLRDVWKRITPYRWQFITATMLRAISDVANLYPAVAFAQLSNALVNPATANQQDVLKIFELLAVAVIFRQLSQRLAFYLGYQVAARVSIDAKVATIRHMEALDIGWHEHENSGNKLKRIDRGGDGLERVLRLWVNSYIEIFVNFVGISYIVTRIDAQIGIMLIIYGLVYYLISTTLRKPAVAAIRLANIQEEDFSGLAFELIANIRTVKVLAMGRTLLKKTQVHGDKLFAAYLRRMRLFTALNTAIGLWSEIGRLTIVGVIIINIFQGHYQIGFLVLVLTYFGRINEAIAEWTSNAQDLAVARDGTARMQEILSEPILINEQEKQLLPENWRTINVSDLAFGYGGKKVLNHLSFTIQRGEKIGIVGVSGAGKSTLFKLLLKEYEGFQGDIKFDDTPIQSISPTSYFQRVAVVLQDTEVFNFSLKENVILANEDQAKNNQDFVRALVISHVDEFVDKLPQGVDTLIGEKGFRLSGGERQRLGIARAVFKEPDILFLDEATSHLDSESEQKIQDSLQKFFKNVTAVVIAHRLSTIRQMDRILVLERGKISEDGSFDALYKKEGRFRELWEKQKL